MPVIGVNLEPALSWRKPAIDYVTHGKRALAEPENAWLLFVRGEHGGGGLYGPKF